MDGALPRFDPDGLADEEQETQWENEEAPVKKAIGPPLAKFNSQNFPKFQHNFNFNKF